MASIRQRQKDCIKQMINLNQQLLKTTTIEPSWKILVFDKIGQDIISPLISVKELREQGVTLFVQLHSDRDQIPEVPVIYFCLPNDDNLNRIKQDFQRGTYDIYHLNFIQPIPRQKLEDLAAVALESNCVGNIHKLYDQHVNFISLEDDMFILRHQNIDNLSYYDINKGNIKDYEMNKIINEIVDSLFSVFATAGTIPIIRSPKGNAAEMVAQNLEKKLRENIFDTRNNFFTNDTHSGNFNFHRPLLIILDRNVDMATPLHHTWTYQALAHDLLDLALNRIIIEDPIPKGGVRSKHKPCELDSNDKFWINHKGSPFPNVAEAIQEELEEYRSSEEEVKKLKVSMGIDNDNLLAVSMVNDNTAKITSAVQSLPQLLEKKRLIDMHASIATVILNDIKSRKLDSFFELEEKIMSKTQQLEKSLMEIINDPIAGNIDDKMRLFIIYYICTNNLTDVELKKYENVLLQAGCDLSPLAYIKRWKNFSKLTTTTSSLTLNQYEGAGTRTVSMFSKLVSQGSNFVMEGVKNLVVKRHNLPVTKIVDNLMESKNSQELDDYHYLDPKLLKFTEIPKNKTFQDAYVFIVGGGNYIEYQNLIDYAKAKTAAGNIKHITYGASNLCNATQFLKQLSNLEKEL